MNTKFSPDLPPLALIAGPTASGKSALAMRLAEMVNGVVINADASQLYNDIPIVSAQPSQLDMTRIPHRLFGYVDGAEACSAAIWADAARATIERTWNEGRVPILAGGTGLYIRTLLDGIAPIPPIDPRIREQVRSLPVGESHAALAAQDPVAAARLAPSDTTRVARALEVVRSTGRPLHLWQQEREGGIGGSVRLVPAILLPPREWLHARCDARFEAMLENDAVAEVEALLARQLDGMLPVMRAIGVREIAAWLRGEISRDQMTDRAKIATRQYAKRQYTWLAHQPPASWPRIDTQLDDDNSTNTVIKLRENLLTG
jgi:tRNA dimethylallyltransferase